MAVLQSHVPCFQSPPGSAPLVGLTSGGSGHDGGFHLQEYHCGELSGSLGKRDQRMERFKEIFHQGGHVQFAYTMFTKTLTELRNHV